MCFSLSRVPMLDGMEARASSEQRRQREEGRRARETTIGHGSRPSCSRRGNQPGGSERVEESS